MITKSIKNYLLAGSVCCGFATALVSCNDFLDIQPTNEIVLENFWTEKADVTSVMMSCYETLASSDALLRMSVWGELRSENIVAGSNISNSLNEILKENLLPTNEFCNWTRFYEAINRCNIVCRYAPDVQAIDPNYTEADMKANVAEAVTLRALAYFYLIRTFRDVPYVTEPSIDDTQNYIVAATPFNEVLDKLIADLESVKNDAVRRYYVEESYNAYVNSSRVTRWTIYALLADLYLWKGDWDNAIKYCDLVIDYKKQLYEEMLQREGTVNNIALIDSIPMILEMPVGSTTAGNTYNELFVDGNSFESIFELYYKTNQANGLANGYYSLNGNLLGRFAAPDELFKGIVEGEKTDGIFKPSDGRCVESVRYTGTRFAITKYTLDYISYQYQTNKMTGYNNSARVGIPTRANWIIYRLSDMLLIKAEALVERNQPGDLEMAFRLVDVVNRRANNTGSGSSRLNKSDYVDTQKAMESLVLEERHREFIFEGKRWYDLVRFARREGNNSRLSELCTRKLKEGKNVIKIKLANPDIIYFPYSKNELKVNPLLHQNPAFSNGEDNEVAR